ncbi:MAG: type II toxin-antitoxin system HicB family antitoxin [Sphaerospermopsis kisseleviana]
MNHHYSILIQWSDEDKKYIVSLPEFGLYAHTHRETYAEALKNGEEVLELLIEEYQLQGRQLPEPLTVGSHP